MRKHFVAITVAGVLATLVPAQASGGVSGVSDTRSGLLLIRSADLPAGTTREIPSGGRSDEDVSPTLPPVTASLMRAASDLRDRFEGRPDFGHVTIRSDRSGIDLYWNGPLPADVREDVAASHVAVQSRETKFQPGDLRKEAERLVWRSPAARRAGVVYAYPNEDSSALIVGLDRRRDQRASLDTAYPSIIVPTDPIRPAQVQPYRLSDLSPFSGGARIALRGGNMRCTDAFAMADADTGNDGMSTAAHCADVGSV